MVQILFRDGKLLWELPFGNLLHSELERSTTFHGKIQSFDWAIFNSYVTNSQRVICWSEFEVLWSLASDQASDQASGLECHLLASAIAVPNCCSVVYVVSAWMNGDIYSNSWMVYFLENSISLKWVPYFRKASYWQRVPTRLGMRPNILSPTRRNKINDWVDRTGWANNNDILLALNIVPTTMIYYQNQRDSASFKHVCFHLKKDKMAARYSYHFHVDRSWAGQILLNLAGYLR